MLEDIAWRRSIPPRNSQWVESLYKCPFSYVDQVINLGQKYVANSHQKNRSHQVPLNLQLKFGWDFGGMGILMSDTYNVTIYSYIMSLAIVISIIYAVSKQLASQLSIATISSIPYSYLSMQQNIQVYTILVSIHIMISCYTIIPPYTTLAYTLLHANTHAHQTLFKIFNVLCIYKRK